MVNLSKYDVFCKGETSEFPLSMKSSHVPHFGAPIGDYLFCENYAASKRGHEVVIQTGRSRGLRPSGGLDSASFVRELYMVN